MITITHSGSLKNTERLLKNAQRMQIRGILEKCGNAGVLALSSVTPVDSGDTAASWKYAFEVTKFGYGISWYNTNVRNGVPIAIIIQFGHGTGTGGYVQPRDYINPAMRGIFDQVSEAIRKELSNL